MCQDRTDDMLETHFTCKGKKYPVIGLTGGVGAGFFRKNMVFM